MKARCFNPDHKDFKYYGGRGISVCDRWLKFENFIQDMIASWGDGLSIDRINNDGNYEPSNCRWATVNIQRRNTCLLRGNNTSGYRGVSFNKRDKRWMATISIDGKHKTIGYFSTALESAQAYDKFVIENNFEHTINGVCHENI